MDKHIRRIINVSIVEVLFQPVLFSVNNDAADTTLHNIQTMYIQIKSVIVYSEKKSTMTTTTGEQTKSETHCNGVVPHTPFLVVQ